MVLMILFFLVAAAVPFLPQSSLAAAPHYLGISLLLFSFFWVAATLAYKFFLLKIVRKAEKRTPFIIELAAKSPFLRLLDVSAQTTAALAFLIAIDLSYLGFLPVKGALAANIFLQGATYGLLCLLAGSIKTFLDPFAANDLLQKEAEKNSSSDKAKEFCLWLGALCEVAARSLHRGETSLSSNALQCAIKAACSFFPRTAALDESHSYVLFYLLGKLDYLHALSIGQQIESVGSEVMTSTGKLAIHLGNMGGSLAAFPIQYIGKWTIRAQKGPFPDAGIKGSCLLLEVAKELTTSFNKEELQEPFISAAMQLAEIARVTFRHDKSVSIPLIAQPLRELLAIATTSLAGSPAYPSVEAAIKNVLDEFDALQSVMLSIPPTIVSDELLGK